MNDKQEFEKTIKMINDSFPDIDKMNQEERKDYFNILDQSSNYEIERIPTMEMITDEPNEIIF
jgi:hypothetical protein